jgi:hypothetical protein
VDYEGNTQYRVSETHWGTALGTKLCIVDIDTRPLNGDKQVFDPRNVTWSQLEQIAGGMLNHYVYGKYS